MLRVFLNCFQLLQISFCCSKNGPFSFYRNPIFINWKKLQSLLKFPWGFEKYFSESLAFFVVGRVMSVADHLTEVKVDWTSTRPASASYAFVFCVLVTTFCFLPWSILLLCFVHKLIHNTCMPFTVVSLFCVPLTVEMLVARA